MSSILRLPNGKRRRLRCFVKASETQARIEAERQRRRPARATVKGGRNAN